MRDKEYHPLPLKFMDNVNTKIDQLLQIRQDANYNYTKATNELIEMGVKIGKKADGRLALPSSFQPYIDKYNISNSEFEWEVEYIDGKILKQFEGSLQHNFSHIEQSKIKTVSYISNFLWPTDNKEKRVIVRLNWDTGLFDLMNGFAPQNVKSEICIDKDQCIKKLILFQRKRFSSINGMFNGEGDFFFYNRFVLGYETTEKNKRVVIIDPTGIIKLFE